MKVVHISTVHPAFDGRIFYRECISLANAGFDVIYLVRHNESGIIREGVKIISLGTPPKVTASLRPIDRIRHICSALITGLRLKADVYHIHDPELLVIVPFLKLFSSGNVIFDCHEDNIALMRQKWTLPAYSRNASAKIMGLLEHLATHFSDAIVTADPGVEKRFKEAGAKTKVLYNFPKLKFFSLPPLPKKEYDLVYHGTLPKYHMEVFFAVDDALIKRGSEVRWLFLGNYAQKAWAEKQITARSASHRFTMKGFASHDKVAEEVRKARIGIIPLPDLPKFRHNIPTKLFEFMALKMPVVMSDLPPSRPFVGDGKCGIMVPPSDYDAYAEAIINLLDDSALCTRLGKTGRKRVETDYNWDKEAEKLVNLYLSLN